MWRKGRVNRSTVAVNAFSYCVAYDSAHASCQHASKRASQTAYNPVSDLLVGTDWARPELAAMSHQATVGWAPTPPEPCRKNHHQSQRQETAANCFACLNTRLVPTIDAILHNRLIEAETGRSGAFARSRPASSLFSLSTESAKLPWRDEPLPEDKLPVAVAKITNVSLRHLINAGSLPFIVSCEFFHRKISPFVRVAVCDGDIVFLYYKRPSLGVLNSILNNTDYKLLRNVLRRSRTLFYV